MQPPTTFLPALPHSSPHSSDEATHHDTPSTNLTAFSPETTHKLANARAQPMFNLNVAVGKNFGKHGDDVFLNAPTPTFGRTQLSPTATAFMPGQYSQYNPGHNATASTASAASYLSTESAQTVIGGVPVGRAPSVGPQYRSAEYESMSTIGESSAGPQDLTAAFGRVRLENPRPVWQAFPEISLQNYTSACGTFATDESMKRAIVITNVGSNVSWISIAQAFTASRYPSQKGINATGVAERGSFSMDFGDIRDTIKAFDEIAYCRPEWGLIPLSPKAHAEYILAHDSESKLVPAEVSDYEGQVLVTVFFDGRTPNRPAIPVINLLQQALFACGTVKAFHTLPADQGNVRDFRVEFCDTRSVEVALHSLKRSLIGDFVVAVERFTPDVIMPPVQPASPPHEIPSMTGRSTVPVDEMNRQVTLGLNMHVNPYAPLQQGPMHYNNDIAHNHVDIGRIQAGVDVRTTIMLRNIPNKIDQAMLKAILDETSFGCYDFMYLRIDFANNCKFVHLEPVALREAYLYSVGYAFVNFTDALAIIPFALARSGQRWNRFNSDKVAEISYATIQGRDCLVQKFRNSSVMLEHPTFRPKLYTTGPGPDGGKEEKFPGPDNPSKMRRSVENAEHVGLFPSTQQGPPGFPQPFWPDILAHKLVATQGASPPLPARSHDYFPLTPQRYARRRGGRGPFDPRALAGRIPFAPRPQYLAYKYENFHTMPKNNADSSSRLFAPREGQIYRDQQRSRRDQYDRGNTRSNMETIHNQYRLRDPARSPPYAPRAYSNLGHYNESHRTNTARPYEARPSYYDDRYMPNGY